MGRRPLSYYLLDKFGSPSHENSTYIVVYDFSTSKGRSISITFYRNLRRICNALNDGFLVQKSVFECKKKNTALAVAELAKLYGARVRVYEVSSSLNL